MPTKRELLDTFNFEQLKNFAQINKVKLVNLRSKGKIIEKLLKSRKITKKKIEETITFIEEKKKVNKQSDSQGWTPNFLKQSIENYHKGCEIFGIWWKVFTASMLSFAIIFISVAIILAVLYL